MTDEKTKERIFQNAADAHELGVSLKKGATAQGQIIPPKPRIPGKPKTE